MDDENSVSDGLSPFTIFTGWVGLKRIIKNILFVSL
jgi:hypothetical protein